MLAIEGRTIGDVFNDAVGAFEQFRFLMVPSDAERTYLPDGWVCTYSEAAQRVAAYSRDLQARGYGHGHRIAVLLENRPEMLLVKLACNQLGISWVPINPDYRAAEMAYVLADSAVSLVITVAGRAEVVREAIAELDAPLPCLSWEMGLLDLTNLPPAVQAAPLAELPVTGESEASLLYTSGTTGRPKGCIISHEYELMMGTWYAARGGRMALSEGGERLYNPLPLFHINAGIVGFYGMLVTGNCLVVPERFSARRWWRDIRETEATGVHYLGVVIPVLMNEAPSQSDTNHKVRWAFGAGVEPTLHRAFEERFGFPLVEGWGMTEACRILTDSHEPRQVDTRAMGRPEPGLEIRVVDNDDRDVPVGEAGEMVLRHSDETPRRGAFSGYLNQPEATEHGWRGGWWHTGDTVRQDESGMVYFVDRKKNIIRRSGENIAAAEVEAVLQAQSAVTQVAVIAVEDEMRDEEVLAAVVLAGGEAGGTPAEVVAARELFDECYRQLAYYKAPGWFVFVDELPITGTQKVLKHMIFGDGVDPRKLPRAHDLRALKVRG